MYRPKVVLDTNVLVSGAITRRGPNAIVMDRVAGNQLRLFVSAAILMEYEEVFARAELPLDRQRVRFARDLIRAKPTIVIPSMHLSVSRDEPDNRFLECAAAGDADHLVTGNKTHFPDHWKRARIVNARELLDLLGVSAR